MTCSALITEFGVKAKVLASLPGHELLTCSATVYLLSTCTVGAESESETHVYVCLALLCVRVR